ncbi:MAG: anaerobic ribonucleoside-triphosphate reductase activating protein, partial [Acetatifactor sp.]|nr:anaerobic ribonucleoside-triphosphate reductase activating protein [Acetatifactor sp.]
MNFCGMNKTTLLDYPGHVAAALFTGGCNMRCPFCQNSTLVLNPQTQPEIPEKEVLAFLQKRQGVLEGICITGGEPTLQPDLESLIRRVRKLGYLVKLDTNGYRPQVLKHLLEQGLLDYVAMDIKA